MADEKVKFLMRIEPDTDRNQNRHTVSQLPKPE